MGNAQFLSTAPDFKLYPRIPEVDGDKTPPPSKMKN